MSMTTDRPDASTKEKIRKKKSSLRIRTWIQWFFLILVLAISINHALEEMGVGIPFLSAASLHAICPFGGVVTLWQFVTQGTFIQKIHESSLILMSAALLLGVLFGPVICGWVCPFGTVQEWLGRLGRKLVGKRHNRPFPKYVDLALRQLRVVLLVLVVINTAISGKLLFQDYDPYYALFNFWTNEVAWTAYAILGITVVLSLIVERPWCKYACPMEAVFGGSIDALSTVIRDDCSSAGLRFSEVKTELQRLVDEAE